ncbi:hypothetical protein VTK56DRAFT_5037 [Thermocarpiscus australiensis]
MELYSGTTLLVDLRFTIYWDSGRSAQRFAPVAFAANVITENLDLFLQSLDSSCFRRIRAAARYTKYKFDKPINYEVERSFIWKGLDDSKLSIRGLSEAEFENQMTLMRKRGYQDHVRVDMAIEIEAGEELYNTRGLRLSRQFPSATPSVVREPQLGEF